MKVLTKSELKRLLDEATSIALCSTSELVSVLREHPSCKRVLVVIER